MNTAKTSGRKRIIGLTLIIVILAVAVSSIASLMARDAKPSVRLQRALPSEVALGERRNVLLTLELPWGKRPTDLDLKISPPFAVTATHATRSGIGMGTFRWLTEVELAGLTEGQYDSVCLSVPMEGDFAVEVDLGRISVITSSMVDAQPSPVLASLPEEPASGDGKWLIALVAIAVCTAAVAIAWGRRAPSTKEPELGSQVLDALERTVADDTLNTEDKDERVSELIREYLTGVWEVPISTCTTEECLSALSDTVPAKVAESLRHYLTLVERLKYSPHVNAETSAEHLEAAKEFVTTSQTALEDMVNE